MSEVKSGDQFLKEFFECLDNISDVDKKLANKLKELYTNGKLTETNIKNMLDKIIEEAKNEN